MKSREEIYKEMQKHLEDPDHVIPLTTAMQCTERDLQERIIQDQAVLSQYKKRLQVWKWVKGDVDAIQP